MTSFFDSGSLARFLEPDMDPDGRLARMREQYESMREAVEEKDYGQEVLDRLGYENAEDLLSFMRDKYEESCRATEVKLKATEDTNRIKLEVELLKKDITEVEAETIRLKDERIAAEKELAELNAKIRGWEESIYEKDKTIAELRRQIEMSDKKKAAIKKKTVLEKIAAIKEKADLDAEIVKLDSEIMKLKKQKQMLKNGQIPPEILSEMKRKQTEGGSRPGCEDEEIKVSVKKAKFS